jgi:hypothetical protein
VEVRIVEEVALDAHRLAEDLPPLRRGVNGDLHRVELERPVGFP